MKDLEPVMPGRFLKLTRMMDARWIGTCQADQKPGDMMINGMILNVPDINARQQQR